MPVDRIKDEFRGKIEEGYAKVIVSKEGLLYSYGREVGLRDFNDGDNSINCLCVGAKQTHEDGEIFVVFKEKGTDVIVLRYEGTRLFPDLSCSGFNPGFGC